MFDTAFFGYSDLPDCIEIEGKSYVPLKAIRVKYHGTYTKKTPFDVENLKMICKVLGINIYRPVKGLYCVEKLYAEFFDALYHFYCEKKTELTKTKEYFLWGWGTKYYNYYGDLMTCGNHYGNSFYQVLIGKNEISNLYDNFLRCTSF
jgi:hypothetical protein